ENIRTGAEGTFTHAIDRDALLRRKTTDRHHVAPARSTFARWKRNTGNVAQDFLKGLGILLLQDFGRNNIDGLRRIYQWRLKLYRLWRLGLEGRGDALDLNWRQLRDTSVLGRGHHGRRQCTADG